MSETPRLSDAEDERSKRVTFQVDSSNKPADLNGRFTGSLFFCIFISVFGATFAVGYYIGLFNTPQKVLQGFINETYYHRNGEYISSGTLTTIWSWTNGLYALGGAFGGLFTGIFVTRFGNKGGMLIMNGLVIVAGVIFVISKEAKSYETLLVGRFLTGFISGFFCGICPIYTSEIPPQNLRGLTGTINALAMCIGNLFANIFGLTQLFGTERLWPYMLGLMFVPAAVHLVGLPFCVESPKYLYITKNRPDLAEKSLRKLRGKDADQLVQNELEQLAAEKDKINKQVKVPYVALVTKPALRRALTVSLVLQAAQQFSGIIAVISYSTIIFKSIGLEEDSWAVYATILISTVETIAHLVCVFLIDRIGRKILLIMGMLGMGGSCFVLAIARNLADKADWLKFIAVIAIVIYIIFYSFGPGPIPLLVTAELFNTDSRGQAVSIAVFFNWFFNFIVTTTFLYIENGIGGYSFVIYGALLVIFALFTYFKVPETKNKSIEEIVKHFEHYQVDPVAKF